MQCGVLGWVLEQKMTLMEKSMKQKYLLFT